MVELNLEIDDETKTFQIPESWDEVDVETFGKLFSFNREELTPIDIAVKSLSVFTNIDEETFMMMNYDDFLQIVDVISFTNKDIDPTPYESLECEGETYYIKNDFSQLTMGEVVSIETLLSNSNDNIFSSMAKLLCIFLRKKKDNGKLELFKGEFLNRQDKFKKLPVSKVYNIFVFFLNGGTLSEDNTKGYLVNESQ